MNCCIGQSLEKFPLLTNVLDSPNKMSISKDF